MGQTVGLELMARYEENRSPFRIRHAIRLDGSTARRLDGSTLVDMVDMVELTPFQVQPLATPSTVLPDELAWGNITKCPHITCRGGEDGWRGRPGRRESCRIACRTVVAGSRARTSAAEAGRRRVAWEAGTTRRYRIVMSNRLPHSGRGKPSPTVRTEER